MLEILFLVIPFFAVIGGGYLGARLIGREGQEGINTFVVYFALPVLLFSVMAKSNIAERFQSDFVTAYAAVSISLFVITLVILKGLFGMPRRELAVQALASVYGNTGYMGIPIIVVMLGQAASVPVVIALLTDIILMIPIAAAIVESDRKPEDTDKGGLVHGAINTIAGTLKNPLVVAAGLGICWSLLAIPVPEVLNGFLDLLGAAAAPCALFALGSSLYGKPLGHNIAPGLLLSVFKLVAHPILLFVAMSLIWQVDPAWIKPAVIAAGLPVAVTVFVVARQYNAAVTQTSSTILISTAISLASVPLLIAILEVFL